VIHTSTRVVLALAIGFCSAAVAFAQGPSSPSGQEDDAVLKPAEPDFTLINLPTSLRLPRFKSAFRVTHRFVRPLKCDECPNSLLADAFGIDNGALIGLEYRFGIVPNGEIVFYRSRTDRSIEFLGQYGITRQNNQMPVEISALAAVEGTNNFRDVYSPTLGLIVSRLVGERGAIHVEPIWVHNSNLAPDVDDDDTFMVGLGGRLRIRPTVYLVGEFTPRVAGFKPGTTLGSFAIEKRLGGHIFQLNFSNSSGTTMRQIAEGAPNNDDWYMGFNISRKFF